MCIRDSTWLEKSVRYRPARQLAVLTTLGFQCKWRSSAKPSIFTTKRLMSGPSRVVHDFRDAIRVLRNSPGFSVVAIATIALAIGANTAMFSFVNGILLSPLPYPDSDRVVRVLARHPIGGLNGISTLN